jgi:hypothetical protein
MLALALALVVSQPPSPWLAEARELMRGLRFAEAAQRLEVARQVPSLQPEERQLALELLGYCHVALGQREKADAAYVALLREAPQAELTAEYASPKVQEAFDAAKRSLYPPDYVLLESRPAAPGRGVVALVDPWKLVEAVAVARRLDGGPWELETLEPAATLGFALVAPAGARLEWYVEARRRDGSSTSLGSAVEPRLALGPELFVTAPPEVTTAADSTPPRRVAGIVVLVASVVAASFAAGLHINGWNQRLAARDRTRPPGDYADTALAAERDGATQQAWGTGLFIGAGVGAAAGVVLAW